LSSTFLGQQHYRRSHGSLAFQVCMQLNRLFCYMLDNPKSDSDQDKRFFSSAVQTCYGIHSASCSRVSGVLSVGVKWPGYVVYCSPLSSAEIKNDWSYASASPMCLCGMDRDNCSFTLKQPSRTH